MDIQRLKEILDKQGSFVIVVGENYALDEMAGSLGLYLSLRSMGRDVSILSPKAPLVEVSNLVGIDRVKQNYEGSGGDLIVAFPYRDEEIGKVSYTLDQGYLNIVVKPKGESLSFGEKDVIFKRAGQSPSVLITVGVKRLSNLQKIFNLDELKDTTIVNIDKGEQNEGFGDVVMIGQSASSVSEQIANLILTMNYPLDPDVSQNIFSGITQATGNFQSPRTSSLAFEMAGIMLRSGARREQKPKMTPIQRQGIRELQREKKGDEAPPDWLSPKIFKGSTNVE